MIWGFEMKEKYVEERFPLWFVFGHQIGVPTTVDLSDGTRDIFQGVSKETAKALISARAAFVNDLCLIFADDPEALYKLKVQGL